MQWLRPRFSLRTLLIGVPFVAFALSVTAVYRSHRNDCLREYTAIEVMGKLDISGYQTENSLPVWLVKILPETIAQDFEHITDINLSFNHLSYCRAMDVRDLHACCRVHTLRLHNVTVTKEMYEAIAGFPRLKTLYIRDWFDEGPPCEVDLRSLKIPGVQTIVEND
jgi:hypothetical protein